MDSQRPTFIESGLVVALAASALLLSACSQNGTGSAQPQEGAPSSGAAIATAAFSAFAGTIPKALENKQCSLDLINGEAPSSAAPIASGSAVIFGGWGGNGHGQAADKFELVLKGAQLSYAAPMATGVERADVAKAWNSEGMAKSGYNLAATLTGVAAGAYTLYVVDPASAVSDCDLHRTLTVQ